MKVLKVFAVAMVGLFIYGSASAQVHHKHHHRVHKVHHRVVHHHHHM